MEKGEKIKKTTEKEPSGEEKSFAENNNQVTKNKKDKAQLNKVRHRSIELFSEKMILKNALKQINVQKDEIEQKNRDLQQKNEEILTQQEHLVKANLEINEKNEKLNKALAKARKRTIDLFGKHIDLKKAKNYISFVNTEIEEKNARLEKAIKKARKRTIDLFGKHIDLKKAKKRIEFQSKLLQKSYDELELKNMQIHDSIDYAKHIQRAIIPPLEDVHTHFNDCFVFFKPKEVVSGDFFWLAEKNNIVYLAVIDCTGHGVPGAFMSMMGNTMLNQIVSEKPTIQPAELLESLNVEIYNAFYRDKKDSDFQNDGMDITICKYDKINNKLSVSSAGQNYYLISDGHMAMHKGNLFGIGELVDEKYEIRFEEITLDIDSTQQLYMFTDGVVDQFGGERNKKFTQKRFLALIAQIYSLPMARQKDIIVQHFNQWKGDEPQLDDVLVIGLKFL